MLFDSMLAGGNVHIQPLLTISFLYCSSTIAPLYLFRKQANNFFFKESNNGGSNKFTLRCPKTVSYPTMQTMT